MAVLKIANLNAEWMVNFFDQKNKKFWQGKSKSKGFGRKPNNVQVVAEKLAGVIKELEAEIIGIEEGPPTQQLMELFVKEYLDNDYDVYSMPHGRQSIHALVRKDLVGLKVEQMKGTHPIYRHIARGLEYYTWGEVKKSRIDKFTRKPVVLKVSKGDQSVEIFVYHTKSKIAKLKTKKQYTSKDREAMIDALRSRQKLSAEMWSIRRYLSHAILSQRTDGIILLGDLNDGPHRDVFEKHFLIHNIVDELRGGFHREKALMHHAFRDEFLEGKQAYTAQFRDPTQDGKRVKVMLDHILVTSSVKDKGAPLKLIKNSGVIEHEAYEKFLTNSGLKGDERPCDHRPVSARFKY